MKIKFTMNRCFILILLFVLVFSCNNKQNKGSIPEFVHKISSQNEFNQAIAKAGKTLIVLDLYADWCGPCKMLGPIMEKIAFSYKSKALFYKVNVDELRQIASEYRTTGIPYVVFIKENKVVNSLIGLYPAEQYIKLINEYSENNNNQ